MEAFYYKIFAIISFNTDNLIY